MQTFLPFPDFKLSAKVLDYRRLGKQRVECLQLLRGQWKAHPVAKMWFGYEFQLANYGIAICKEWISRKYKDTCLNKIYLEQIKFKNTGLPKWFGLDIFHNSHKSNLLKKDFNYYQKYFSDINPNLPYYWPCKDTNDKIIHY